MIAILFVVIGFLLWCFHTGKRVNRRFSISIFPRKPNFNFVSLRVQSHLATFILETFRFKIKCGNMKQDISKKHNRKIFSEGILQFFFWKNVSTRNISNNSNVHTGNICCWKHFSLSRNTGQPAGIFFVNNFWKCFFEK